MWYIMSMSVYVIVESVDPNEQNIIGVNFFKRSTRGTYWAVFQE